MRLPIELAGKYRIGSIKLENGYEVYFVEIHENGGISVYAEFRDNLDGV